MVPKSQITSNDGVRDAESAKIYGELGNPSGNSSKLKSVVPVNHIDIERTKRCEYLFDPLPSFLRQWVARNMLRDECHIHIFIVALNVLLVSVPMALGLFYLEGKIPTPLCLVLGLTYSLFHLISLATGINFSMHNQAHKSIFNKKF